MTKWLLYSVVMYSDKTVAVELNADAKYRKIAIGTVDESNKNDDFIEDIGGFSARILRDTLLFVCVYKKSEDTEKARKYLYDIKNSFAFKYCGGVLSKAKKADLKKNVHEFKEELAKAAEKYETGINRELVAQANKKVGEVAEIMQNAIKNQYAAVEGTEHLLDVTNNIFIEARDFEKDAKKLEPTCCQKFWACSKPCMLMFLTIISAFIVYGVVSLTMCGDITLISGC